MIRLARVVVCVVPVIVACGKKTVHTSAPPPAIEQFHALKDPAEAPKAVKDAADAVVRITSERGGRGTGSFISADGLLLTNNHVMGAPLCGEGGCYFRLNTAYERGARYERAALVFGEPVFASPELDVAVLQVRELDGGGKPAGKLASPRHLTLADRDPDELAKEPLYLVGHPHGGLKKWSTGEVYTHTGKWMRTTHFALGGNSGSPLVDAEGRLVAVLHRGPERAEAVTARDLQTFAITTPARAILAAYRPDGGLQLREGLFLATSGERADEGEAVSFEEIYFNGHLPRARVKDGGDKDMMPLIGAACDRGLDDAVVSSYEDLFDTDFAACEAAYYWLNCVDRKDGDGYKTCPADADKAAWRARFARAATKAQEFNGVYPYFWRVMAPSALAGSEADARRLGREGLDALVAERNPPLSFLLASYLVEFGAPHESPAYQGTLIADYAKGYASQPHYPYFVPDLVDTLSLLASHEHISRDELKSTLASLLRDPDVNVRDRLLVERTAYQWRVLEP